jgi:plastocyanin
MRRRGRAGRRLRLGFVLAFAVALLGTGVALAQAAEVIVGEPTNLFSKDTYTSEQGVVVQFQNNGGSHNVTARQNGPDGKALFRSATISGGTTPVDGTQYLSSGDYAFFCTIHPTTMNGTLRVTGAGTPLPRPRATLSLKRKSLAKAIKKGILVGVNTSTKIDGVTLTAKLGKATIGKATVSVAAGSQALVVKLSKAGKSKLRGRDTAKVTVTADIPFGSPASTKAKLS